MKRKIIATADGSSTIFLPKLKEHYHSVHGAIQESRHVFIEMGLAALVNLGEKHISILEMGFGTGLNALITLLEAQKKHINIDYTAIEAYPVTPQEISILNYPQFFSQQEAKSFFQLLHEAEWEKSSSITPFFKLLKKQQLFEEMNNFSTHDLIYFDVFGARVQPELWTEIIFKKMFQKLRKGGCLVTYSAKGSVRRGMQEIGFKVERLPGPPGKREMLRAWK